MEARSVVASVVFYCTRSGAYFYAIHFLLKLHCVELKIIAIINRAVDASLYLLFNTVSILFQQKIFVIIVLTNVEAY